MPSETCRLSYDNGIPRFWLSKNRRKEFDLFRPIADRKLGFLHPMSASDINLNYLTLSLIPLPNLICMYNIPINLNCVRARLFTSVLQYLICICILIRDMRSFPASACLDFLFLSYLPKAMHPCSTEGDSRYCPKVLVSRYSEQMTGEAPRYHGNFRPKIAHLAICIYPPNRYVSKCQKKIKI